MSKRIKHILPILMLLIPFSTLVCTHPAPVHEGSPQGVFALSRLMKTGKPTPQMIRQDKKHKTHKRTVWKPKPLSPFTLEEKKRIRRVQRHIRISAQKYDLSPSLINGIIWIESKFEIMARGYRGSRGLMQLMPRTSRAIARELKLKHRPYAPRFNIEAGCFYFSKLLDRFDGRIRVALAAYKQGPASIKAILRRGEPIPGGSRRYAARVLAAARTIRDHLNGAGRSNRDEM